MKKLALLVIVNLLFGPVAVFYLLWVYIVLWAIRQPKRGSNQYRKKYKLM